MNVPGEIGEPVAPSCPVAAATSGDPAGSSCDASRDHGAGSPLTIGERLFVPHRKRMVHSYHFNEEGARELRLDYGLKEVTFDEEHLFPFGEMIGKQPSFTGQDAVAWGPGYPWEELQPLLEVLIAEGIIKRGGTEEEAQSSALQDPRGGGLVASLLPPSTCPAHRMWSQAECESISHDLGGRGFEIGNIEAVVPVFRIAHPALDEDQRQVGEGNVFPNELRLDIETEWRVCQYSGSRYRDEAPMNVTGLKAMIKHWKPMMKVLTRARDLVGRRLGVAPGAPWCVGDLYVLSCVVLGLPAYSLMKRGGATPQPPLSSVMSSLFRITDGIRMTTSQLLFSIEHNRPADEPLTAAGLYEAADYLTLFISQTGVCAGPKALIDEFLAIAVDGQVPPSIEEVVLAGELEESLRELPAALDYGFLGMMVWGVSHSVWLAMSRAYEAILPVFESALAAGGAPHKLVEALRKDWRRLERQQITLDYDRDVHDKMYIAAYERSRRGLGRSDEHTPGPVRLAEAIAPRPDGPSYREAAAKIAALLEARRASGVLAALDDAGRDRVAGALADLLRHEQAILTSVERVLAQINGLLDRSPARRALDVRDFATFFSLHGQPRGAFPYLFDTLENELGIAIAATSSELSIADL